MPERGGEVERWRSWCARARICSSPRSTAACGPSSWRRGRRYLLRLIPRGTQYGRLIRPAELARWARAAGLTLNAMAGIELNPFTSEVSLTGDVGVNYLAHFTR